MIRKSLFVIAIFILFFACSVIGAPISDPKYPNHPDKEIELVSSNLPIVIIDLDEKIADKSEDRTVPASVKIIWDKSGGRNTITENETSKIDFIGKAGIRYRGNSTYLLSPKKAFAVKLTDENGKKLKQSILGMGQDNDWVLRAPYGDKTFMRDALVFELMQGTFEFTPTGKYCELVLNGIYQGIYTLSDRVRQGDHRVNIKKPTSDTGDGLTGGYHLEIDGEDQAGFEGEEYIRDLYDKPLSKKTFYQQKYPDQEDLSEAQKNYIKNRVLDMEKAVSGNNFKDPEIGFRAYFDTLSLMDFYIAQELSKSVDGYRRSTPFYKRPDSENPGFIFSIWDFDIAFGNADYADAFSTEGWQFNLNRFPNDGHIPWFFKRILQDEVFYNGLKERWKTYRQYRLSDERILQKIDSIATLVSEAKERNFAAWGNLGSWAWPNYFVGETYEDEVEYLKNWILKRTAWIDSQWITEQPNLVANAGFESAMSKKNGTYDTNFSEWSTRGTVALSTTNKRNGDYAASIQNGGSSTYQVIGELTPGLYDLEFWVKTQQSPQAFAYIKYYQDRFGRDEIMHQIEDNKDYHLIEIKDIEVTNNFLELGFGTSRNVSGDVRIWVDDVKLVKQPTKTALENIDKDHEIIIYADRNTLTLTISISPANRMMNQKISIYDISGRILHMNVISSNTTSIRNIFNPNQLYIIKVGEYVKKIVF